MRLLTKSYPPNWLVYFKLGIVLQCLLLINNASAQTSYTYEPESFEENSWSNAPDSENSINSITGTWSVRKGNIQTTDVGAYNGEYCLILAEKTNSLITPRLDNGAGTLEYYAIKTGSRTINVEGSADMMTWSPLDSYPVQDSWTKRTVTINDPEIRYLKFSTNSNKGTYIDYINITSAGAQGVTTSTTIPTNITQTSAIIGGKIVSEVTSAIETRGVCYNSTGYPDINSDKIEVAGTTGEFSATLEGLEMGVTYYIKAYAKTANGISYGLVVPFTTREPDAAVAYWTQKFDNTSEFPTSQPTSPTTISVNNQGEWIYLNAYKSSNSLYITDGSAYAIRMVKNGSYVITPVLDAGVTKFSFIEGRGGRNLTVYTSTENGSNWKLYEALETIKGEYITLLINNGSINRIKIANDSGGDADIDNISVTVYPNGVVPSLATTAVTNIGKNSASTGGSILLEGDKSVIKKGVCWSTITTPIIADNVIENDEVTDTFTSLLADLPAGTKIHVRAFATSRAGTGYGEEVIFTTLAATLPVITTTTATDIKGELATSGGNITDDGGAPISERGICWNTTGDPTINDQKSATGVETGVFESKLTNLQTNTTYYYRAYAQNSAGVGYGQTFSLKTSDISKPTVITNEVSNIFFYKATAECNVTDDGGAMTQSGICWSISENPTIDNDTIICGVGAGTFSGEISVLNENTQYYVRAFAINNAGTVYGNQLSFATPISTKLTKPIGYGRNTTGGGSPTPENTVIVTTSAELASAINSSKSVIIVSGTITTAKITATIKNKTIIGLPGARLVNLNDTQSGSGILFITEGSDNVIIQNLIFEGPGAYDVDGHDLLTNKGCTNLWVDHCEFQDGLDGNFDNSITADDITVSWCKFTYLKPPISGGSGGSADHRFSNLVGGSDSDFPTDGHFSLTWQNCWWTKGVVSRMIRGRNTEVHMLNCYWNSPDTKEAIGLTAGVNGSTVYVEGGVFDIPGEPTGIGSGPIAINFVDCVDGGTNIGVVSKPDYDYLPMSTDEVISAVTSTDCGAGATLVVTTSGEVYSGCPSVPILSLIYGNNQQEIFGGNAIDTIIYSWGGIATDVTISDLPEGLIVTKNTSEQTVTITGIQTAGGTFTLSTLSGSSLPVSKQGTITITSIAPPTLESTGELNQIVQLGDTMTDIVFTWGRGATDVTVENLPSGLEFTKNTTNKTVTINGKPSAVGTFTVTTIGGSGDAVSIEATVNVLFGSSTKKIAYVTSSTSATYMNDLKILPALKEDPNFEVTEINSGVSGNDYSNYDLVIFSEVSPSTDPGVAELKGINKPFIMMKVHSYKSATGAWDWASTTTTYGQSATETNVVVSDKSHPIFKDVNWVNTNEVQILSEVNGLKGLTYADPSQFKNVSNGTIKSLANLKGATSSVVIFEIPAGTNVSGTVIPKGFIQVGINSNSFASVSNDGISIIKNSILYLLGEIIAGVDAPSVKENSSNYLCYPTLVVDYLTIKSSSNKNQLIECSIVNIQGKTIDKMQLTITTGETKLNLSNLPSGLYLIRLTSEESNEVVKVIKQ